MNYKKFIIASGLISMMFVSILPARVSAVIDPIPPIPVSDAAMRTKEVGVTIFGITIPGVTLDSLLIIIVKQVIGKIVDSTVTWIQGGFEGNPAYVTDPKKYFTDVADVVAGEFIEGSDLNFLCSPFQAQIRLSLLNHYKPQAQYQCTLSEIGANLTNFYGDFNQGGWDTWLTMTQTTGGNPYDAYLAAELELDSRIADKLGIEDKKLSWDSGFLSWSKCLEYVEGTSGECKPGKRGPVQTPGKVINDQLTQVLGTGVSQLELADEFDEIVGALVGQLLQTLIFTDNDEGGLFKGSTGGVYDNDSFEPISTPYSNDPQPTTSPTGTWTCPTNLGFVSDPTTGECTYVGTGTGTGTGTIGPDSNGCYGTGCEPCYGDNCGVGETIYGDPAINGVYAGSCLIHIVASFWSSVLMTQDQCNLVNQVISDGITFITSPSTGLPRAVGGTYTDAIKAIILVCGGDGVSSYICGFP